MSKRFCDIAIYHQPNRAQGGFSNQPLSSKRIFRIWAVGYLVALLVYATVIPPFQIPDEPNHFYRVYQIANGHILPDHPQGGMLPSALKDLTKSWMHKVTFHPECKFDIRWLRTMWQVRTHPNDVSVYNFKNTALYSPVPYLPHWLGLQLGRSIGLPPLGAFYTARFSAVFLAWALVLGCFRLAPQCTHPILLLAFMSPMFMYLAAGITADTLTTLFAVALTATVLRERTVEAAITLRSRLFLSSLAVGLALCKPTYAILVFTLTFIPASRFGSPKRKWLWIVTLAAVLAVIALVWNMLVSAVLENVFEPHSSVPAQQAEQLVSDPLKFFRVLRSTLAHFGLGYVESWVGCLGWTEIRLPKFVIITYLAAFALLAAFMPCENILSFTQKLFALLLIMTGMLVALATVYLYFTPVGYSVVLGFQGRYALPYSLLAATLLPHPRWVARTKRIAPTIHYALALSVGTLAFFVAILCVYNRFYGS